MEVKGDNLFAKLFLAEKVPFSDKRDVNWRAVKWTAIALVIAFVMVVLVVPSSPEPEGDSEVAAAAPMRPREFETPQDMGSSSRDLSAYYQRPSFGGGQAPPSRQATMIVGRSGLDYRTQLPPGSRIPVRLLQGAIVSSESMPIIAIVTADVESESGVAIEKGSKIFGEASFDDSGDVASVTWSSIQMADGRERQIAAIGVSLSGHVGVQGDIHSKRAQNVAGGMISRFIGAYAEGSMSRGLLGFSQGGTENGLKQAVAETAKDQADSYASDLKKEKRWIELEAGTDCLAVLKQPFAFRDPGAYAR
ncbi:MAG: TrbI/VirB10 family protein [Bdellovibrionales bacterium]|nr:TrbI/VirB10 family protein [Bdellovibrionales bacterium]